MGMTNRQKLQAALDKAGINVVAVIGNDGIDLFPGSVYGIFGMSTSSRLYAIGDRDGTEGQAINALIRDLRDGSIAAEYCELSPAAAAELIGEDEGYANGVEWFYENIRDGSPIREYVRGEKVRPMTFAEQR